MVTEIAGIAVIGAGPIGCLTAINLLRRGFQVHIFEARPDFRTTTGSSSDRSANLILTSRGLNALHQIGFGAQVLSRCVPLSGRIVHLQGEANEDGSGEKTTKDQFQPYGPDSSFCNYTIPRRLLTTILLNAAQEAGASIYFNHPVQHIDVERKTIHAYIHGPSPFRTTPRLKFSPRQVPIGPSDLLKTNLVVPVGVASGCGYGIALKFNTIMACDGTSSRSRQSLHQFLQSTTGVSAGIATPFGHTIGAIDIMKVQREQGKGQEDEDGKEKDTQQQQQQQHEKDAVPATPNPLVDFRSAFDLSGSYDTTIPLHVSYLEFHIPRSVSALPSIDSGSTPAGAADSDDLQRTNSGDGISSLSHDSLHLWPRGDHFFMALPNSDGSFTATLYLPDVQIGSGPAFSTVRTSEQITGYFSEFYPDIVPLIPNLVTQWKRHPKRPLGSVQSFPWHYRNHIMLLGDAGAAASPFFGQGCNNGMESVFTLFQHLDYFAQAPIPPTASYSPIAPFFNPSQTRKRYTPYVLQRTFSTMSSKHKINTDAIAAMAVENYIEMGTSACNVEFLRGQQYEIALAQNFPQFLSRHTMVTHTTIPYAVIYTLGEIQRQTILQYFLNEEIAKSGPITAKTLLTAPLIDLKVAKNLLEKKYQPILDKYNVNQYSISNSLFIINSFSQQQSHRTNSHQLTPNCRCYVAA